MRPAELARRTGCHQIEAEAALTAEPDAARAEALIVAELQLRRRRYGPRLVTIWNELCVADGAAAPGKMPKGRAQGPIAREIGVDGTVEFVVNCLGIDPENAVLLSVAYELQAPTVAKFTYEGFIDGWARLSCSTVIDMAKCVWSTLKPKFDGDENYFAYVYRFTFAYILPERTRMLPLDIAIAYWQLLLVPRYEVATKWTEFASKQGKAVSVDTWNMVFELCKYARTDPEFSDYDETSAWPAVIDDFVDSLKAST